jgi:hypothetical protein
MKGCGCWGGQFRAPPEGKCGSHTFSLLDAAALGIRVRRECVAEPEFGQIPKPIMPEVAMQPFESGLKA